MSAVPMLPPPPAIDRSQDALFLDFDGTLAPIMPTPGEVRLAPAMRAALAAAAAALGGRLAVVSGRNLETLRSLINLPALGLAGVHGLELMPPGCPAVQTRSPDELAAARAALHAVAAREPRLLVEDKGLGLALHYRRAPDLAQVARAAAEQIAEQCGLMVQPGKMVFEVRPRGADKGDALCELMRAPPFIGTRPIFVGDDVTDESAFRAAAREGGYGILVGPVRETAACFVLPDVAAVQNWLCAAAGAVAG